LSLRSRKVIDEPVGHVQRIEIESTGIHQILRRSSSGSFTLEEPKNLAVDPSLANDIAEALAQLRAERWVAEEDDGSFGLAAPRAKYQIGTEGATIRIETGRATSGGVFARRSDSRGIFVLPEATERTIETWAIDRSYFVIDPAEVQRVVLEHAAQRSVLEPSTGPDAATSAERFEIVKTMLAEARAEGLVHLGPPRKEEGFDKPLLTLSIRRAPPSPASPSTIKITIGRGDVWRDNNVFYVRRDGIDATFAIAQSKLRPVLDMRA
jgi:hypothetical protein